MKLDIKISTIARIASLVAALINQCLAIFGKGALPFTEDAVYQIVSLLATVVIAAINAWYNNDITRIARLCGGVFDALSDGKISEDEIKAILEKDANDTV